MRDCPARRAAAQCRAACQGGGPEGAVSPAGLALGMASTRLLPPMEPGSQVNPPPVPTSSSSLSAKRQRQILAVLLAAFALLAAASVATFHLPMTGGAPW